MKRIVSFLFILSSIAFVKAGVCFDLPNDITAGVESSAVLSLQNLLQEKGFLKNTPNGYFGVGTVKAVKAYQRSLRIPPSGGVHMLTRRAIKKVPCTVPVKIVTATTTKVITTSPIVATSTKVNTTLATTTIVKATTTIVVIPALIGPMPTIIDIATETFFVKSTSSAPFVITGTGFSATSNEVFFKLRNTYKKYSMGKVIASTSTLISVASTLFTGTQLSCGNGCLEFLEPGTYDVTVVTPGGESNTGFVILKGFTGTSETAVKDVAIYYGAKKALIGTITFSTSVPVYLTSLSFTASYDPKPSKGGVSNYSLKDETKGIVVSGLSLGNEFLLENASKVYSIYADVDTLGSSLVTIQPVLSVLDYTKTRDISISIRSFLISISPAAY